MQVGPKCPNLSRSAPKMDVKLSRSLQITSSKLRNLTLKRISGVSTRPMKCFNVDAYFAVVACQVA